VSSLEASAAPGTLIDASHFHKLTTAFDLREIELCCVCGSGGGSMLYCIECGESYHTFCIADLRGTICRYVYADACTNERTNERYMVLKWRTHSLLVLSRDLSSDALRTKRKAMAVGYGIDTLNIESLVA